MPHVAITMIPGRDETTKRELAQKTQTFLQKELGIDPKFISVSIQDIPPDCVYIVSPGASNLISTAGIVVPIILYFIGSSLSGVLNDENTLVLLYPKDTQG